MADFFTSDLHFFDPNIIDYAKRPFKNVAEMNNCLIQNWNNKVKKNDNVRILGDFAIANNPKDIINILKLLNGKKFLIKGNHDKFYLKGKDIHKQFQMIKDYHCLKIKDHYFVLFHYPIIDWERRNSGSIHLYGHIHNHTTPFVNGLERAFNVCADVNDFAPVSYDEIIKKLK